MSISGKQVVRCPTSDYGCLGAILAPLGTAWPSPGRSAATGSFSRSPAGSFASFFPVLKQLQCWFVWSKCHKNSTKTMFHPPETVGCMLFVGFRPFNMVNLVETASPGVKSSGQCAWQFADGGQVRDTAHKGSTMPLWVCGQVNSGENPWLSHPIPKDWRTKTRRSRWAGKKV